VESTAFCCLSRSAEEGRNDKKYPTVRGIKWMLRIRWTGRDTAPKKSLLRSESRVLSGTHRLPERHFLSKLGWLHGGRGTFLLSRVRRSRLAFVSIILIVVLLAVYGMSLLGKGIPRAPMELEFNVHGESPWTVQISCVMSVFVDTINASLTITVPDGIQIQKGRPSWAGSIGAGQEVEINLTILANQPGEYVIMAEGRAWLTSQSWFGKEGSIALRFPLEGG
jgi:hypothetical protein